ncbi:uncharacterized protein J3D65DRAFT_392592 [Phyllosticta citribraziliensis]|uniref:Uncharacterized protein n=1 Tax=Phyllosticta citribraziliensis TaxID=989973 RepID=A0ABR1LMB0_9PEZI
MSSLQGLELGLTWDVSASHLSPTHPPVKLPGPGPGCVRFGWGCALAPAPPGLCGWTYLCFSFLFLSRGCLPACLVRASAPFSLRIVRAESRTGAGWKKRRQASPFFFFFFFCSGDGEAQWIDSEAMDFGTGTRQDNARIGTSQEAIRLSK